MSSPFIAIAVVGAVIAIAIVWGRRGQLEANMTIDSNAQALTAAKDSAAAMAASSAADAAVPAKK